MLIVRFQEGSSGAPRVGVLGDGGELFTLKVERISDILAAPLDEARRLLSFLGPAVGRSVRLLPPVDGLMEVWASGVTYRRSQEARIEESSVKDVYARVYDAPRPELFFKSVAWRVVGDGELIGVRVDSGSNVPEPELAVVVNSRGDVFGYSVCNDVSSRSIEGENPLYLPQAKLYAGACALGPGIRPAWEVDHPNDLGIEVTVSRAGATVWNERTRTSMMKRPINQLVEFTLRGDHFPEGVVLATGTGLVPRMDFTLEGDDVVTISIEQVGSLTNRVTVGKHAFGGRVLTDRWMLS